LTISAVVGVACACTAGSGSAGRPSWVRMALKTVGSSMVAMTFIGLSQREETMTETAKARLSRAAQSRRYADRGGDGFGVLVKPRR